MIGKKGLIFKAPAITRRRIGIYTYSVGKYTQNWNQEFIKNTKNIGNLNICLEIGSFEGLTSNYICDHLLSENGKLICVDPLQDQYLTEVVTEKDVFFNDKRTYFKGQYERFIENTERNAHKIQLIRKTSDEAFKDLIDFKFDFIYIDGDHRPDIVYQDAVNSFQLCKNRGIILFDDYLWTIYDTKSGIDKFLKEYNGRYNLLIKGAQIKILKL